MPPFPKNSLIGELYDPAMSITDQHEADLYFDKLVDRAMREAGMDWREASLVVRNNLAYYAALCSLETLERVQKLFHCKHPYICSVQR